MEVSRNLEDSAIKHLEFLVGKNYISHEGANGSTVIDRAIDSGATALSFGEIIGYSTSSDLLFNSWLESSTHYDVIVDPDWRWIGVGQIEYNGSLVGVVNFSSGNLGSTKVIVNDDRILFTGSYIEVPIIDTKDYLVLKINKGAFEFTFKRGIVGRVVSFKTKNGSISDRLELFFK